MSASAHIRRGGKDEKDIHRRDAEDANIKLLLISFRNLKMSFLTPALQFNPCNLRNLRIGYLFFNPRNPCQKAFTLLHINHDAPDSHLPFSSGKRDVVIIVCRNRLFMELSGLMYKGICRYISL